MGTFKVQARSYTDSSVVNATTSYPTTDKVLYTKKLLVTGDVTAVLPTQGGSLDAGELYNYDAFTGIEEKFVLFASASENNDETVSIYAIPRASGVTAGVEVLLATLAPGQCVAIPFRTEAAVTTRDEFPRLVAVRENVSNEPTLEITINY
jgi:hypothetical protein